MGLEIDLLKNYPKTKRDVKSRASEKSKEDQQIARLFGKEFFDGERKTGYGGFNYHPRFWQPVIPDFIRHYGINKNTTLLDIGCAKGFMLYDFMKIIPGIKVAGIDVSDYAISNSHENAKPFLQVADARKLPFEDNSFDIIISITTLHNLERNEIVKALHEIERVKRKDSFITVDAYSNDEERELMLSWNLTAKTILHVNEWKELFREANYTGDYFWFKP